VFNVFYGNLSTDDNQTDSVLKRTILFSQPIFSNHYKIVLEETARPEAWIRLDIVGLTTRLKNSTNPITENVHLVKSKYQIQL
jgi:hypothetical protein